jgi:hypothetical protein
MKNICAQVDVAKKYGALVCAALLLGATCTAASPITVGSFSVLNDTTDPLFVGPTLVVTNDSVLAGVPATFGSLHLVFDLSDLSILDFTLTDSLGPGAIDSNGLTDLLGNSLLPDLGTVLDAYLTLTLLDPATSATLAGVVSFGPTARMSDFTDGSTLAIQFDPAVPTGPSPIPEPMSLVLVGGGLAACAVRKRWAVRRLPPGCRPL